MLLVATNVHADHHEVPGHPEQPARTRAALDGLVAAGLHDAVVELGAREATDDELLRVHTPHHLRRVASLCAAGGGAIDGDTDVVPGSWATARMAAGAGLAAIDALRRADGAAGLVLARPPGHHAGPRSPSGFCLLNNVAIAAAALVEAGERVAIVDWDVHHGNGTQEVFWDDPRVLFVSLHQRGIYPGTGRVVEVGGPDALGTTMNVPLPEGTAGDALRRAIDELVGPRVEAFAPDWLLVSAGFDGHRADPLAGWMLTAGDYADLAGRLRRLVPPGRTVAFLEGGYELGALRASVGAAGAALLDEPYRPEAASTGSVGGDEVATIARWWQAERWADRAG